MKEKTCKHNVKFQVIGLTCSFITKIDTKKMNRATEYRKKISQNQIEQEPVCKFFRIDPDKKKALIFLEPIIKYLNTSKNWLKKL